MELKSKDEDTNQRLNSLFSLLSEKLPEFFPKTPVKLREMILKTSDQFLFKENKSQWNEHWFQTGYLNYFMPMQYARILKALKMCLEAYPELESEISSVLDFGSGPGPSAIAFNDLFKKLPAWTNTDINKNSHNLAKEVYSSLNIKHVDFKIADQIPASKVSKELLLLSYSLCEGIAEENIFTYDHVFILEPSTKEQSRNLIKLRQKALDHGYQVIAPCTHCETCPMLERKSDWCHDRLTKPELVHLKEVKLPFSDKNLNYSYLFLSKTIKKIETDKVRVIGDFLKEKGKTKIAICKSKDRQFLSWLKRSKHTPTFSRGDLISLPSNTLIKGQEIRISAD